MISLPEDLESYGYKENAAKTFERLYSSPALRPKRKHLLSNFSGRRRTARRAKMLFNTQGKEFLSVCRLGLVNRTLSH